MAHRNNVKVFLFSALLLVLCSTSTVFAEDEDSDDGVTVETVEEQEIYRSPQVNPAKVYLAEHFDNEAAFNKRWVRSEAKKQGVDETIAKYDGKWTISQPTRKILKDDSGLVLTTEAKHAAISTLLDRPFEFKDKPFVVQYEVTMQEGQNCGGAYLKLLSKGTNTKGDLKKFHDQTAYTIMFGPDKCGNDNKLHFIFRHRNPKNGSYEEKHSKKPSQRLEDIYKDKEPHLYTLVVRPDNSYSILVDNSEVVAGSLLADVSPPVNPPEEVDDPADVKPEDWDEREKIVDPSASKPEDWDEDAPAQIVDPNAVKPEGWLDDEPEMISDPAAQRPADWDDDMDGEWEAPLVDNPACVAAPGCGLWKPPLVPNPEYKGIWRAPLIPNPNYKGKWTPRRIPNPDYFRDDHPFRMTPIHAVGFELWSMSPMLLFDNLIITDDVDVAAEWARQSFALKRAKLSKDSQTLWGRVLRAVNYKPGYWAMYITYCLIPLSVYIGYLVKRSREQEDSVVERALKFAAENPWIYALLIIVSFLVVGFIAFLCISKSGAEEEDAKKTDAVLEDDPHQSDEEEAPQERASKADLEGPEADSTEKCPVNLCAPLTKQKVQASEFERKVRQKILEMSEKPPVDERRAKIEEAPLLEPEDGAGDAQRKRKPRKE